ncbi:MAG: xanthine dehydrogenase family protein subunit M [Candidatus Cloacimonetes bacterium]|nr:xanthine dehydrogenase family protein subunit M [Candidatus Cloacimonadota bacterium]
MAITCDFEYIKPQNLDEAIKLLLKHKEKAKILAGGTDIIVYLKEDLINPDLVIDVKDIADLNVITFSEEKVFIGAGVTFSEIIDSDLIKEKLPVLWQASGKVASIGIRNRATLAGNICSAIPSLDSAPALLIYEAKVIVRNSIGERIIPISEWFKTPRKTALKDDEIVIGISIEFPKLKHAGTYRKLSRYEGEDLAQAGIGILALENQQYRIAFCAVGPIPQRSAKIENLLNGNKITDELVQKAKKMIPNEISPITDIRSSKEYRTHMIQVMFERGMKEVIG